MNEVIEIYLDLLNKGCEDWVDGFKEYVMDFLKNCEREERNKILLNIGVYDDFGCWGNDYLYNNYGRCMSGVDKKLNEIFKGTFKYCDESFIKLYYKYMESNDRDFLYSFEEWMEWDMGGGGSLRYDIINRGWYNMNLEETYVKVIEVLSDLGDEGIEYFFNNIYQKY